MKRIAPQKERVLGTNKRISFLNTPIDVLTQSETVRLVEKYVVSKEPLHLIGVNADKINQLKRDRYLKRIVDSCGIINADGASVVLASRFLNEPLPERVAGIDLMNQLIKLSSQKGYSVFLLGAREQVVRKASKRLVARYPKLKVVGIHDGYFDTSRWFEISKILKKKDPDFVFVGITSPKKEYLIEYLQSQGIRSVFMGIGGSLDVISGKISRAPEWMQQFNLEWLFRVFQEPKRLFGRYFVGNFIFINNVIKEKVVHMFK